MHNAFLLIIAVTMLNCSSILLAQANAFTVLNLKGKVSVAANKTAAAKPVKAGQKIASSAILLLETNSYTTLMYTSGATLELKNAGKYAVADLVKKAKAIKSSVLNNYTKLIAKELIAKSGSSNEMTTLGSVTRRGIPPIIIDFPGDTYTIDTVITIRWYTHTQCTGYKFILTNDKGEEVFSQPVSDTVYTFNLRQLMIEPEKLVQITVKSKDNQNITSEPSSLIKYLPAKEKIIRKDLLAFQAINVKESPMACLTAASYFESKKLIADAYIYYKRAAELLPQDNAVKNMLFSFRERHFINQ